MKNSNIVGVILAYNCATMLERAYRTIPVHLFDAVIVVDDGSTDETMAVAHRLGLPAYTHEHRGYGGNIKFGLRKAVEMGAEYIVEIHGDGQYDMSNTNEALAMMKRGYDLVLGSRFTDWRHPLRDHMSLIRYVANFGLSTIDRLVLQVPLTEFHSGFRVYSRRLVERVSFVATSDDYLYSFEIIAQARYYGLAITEIPMRCTYKEEHTSISLRKSFIYAMGTFRVLGAYVAARLGFRPRLFGGVSRS
jgi:glycosyltransferase involved in cell wall biosynthesis